MYMLEIERKYLCNKNIPLSKAVSVNNIEQFYLSTNIPEITSKFNPSCEARVYIRRGTSTTKAKLTIKSLANLQARDEFEYEIPIEHANMLKQYRIGSIINKDRYFIPFNKAEHKELAEDGVNWEVDVYQKDQIGLLVAEVELPSKVVEQYDGHQNVIINLPEWINKEVTGNKELMNSYIALHGVRPLYITL